MEDPQHFTEEQQTASEPTEHEELVLLRDENEKLGRDLGEARKMLVFLMEPPMREWGAATGALLSDPVIKAAYRAAAAAKREG